MKTQVLVRDATVGDMPALAELFSQYRTFYEQAVDLPKCREFLMQRLRNQDAAIFVAEGSDGVLAGFVQLYPTFSSISAKPAWILNDLFVAPISRGKGVASALMAHALKSAKHTGAAWVALQTARDNLAAQALYRRCGFAQEQHFLTFNHSLQGL